MPVATKTLTFVLRPTSAQCAELEMFAGARRYAFNWALERTQSAYLETGRMISLNQLSAALTELKRDPEHAWLKAVDSQLLQQALFDLRRAFRNFFERRARYPRFKSRKSDKQRFRIPQRVVLHGQRVYVPKIGWIRVRGKAPESPVTKSATFVRDGVGRWRVRMVTEFEVPEPSLPEGPARAVGIDLGVREFAVLSDGQRVPTPAFYGRYEKRLRRAHRDLSRKARGSRNRRKARKLVARLHGRIADRRKDFLHKLSHALVKEHDLLCIEDIGVDGLARTKLSKRMHDAALGEFRRQLAYKALWNGKVVVPVDRFFPSSRLCAICGAINRELQPGDRVWVCSCGASHDRDFNAAQNLLAEGQRLVTVGRTDTENACGVRVRLPMEAADEEAGIPA